MSHSEKSPPMTPVMTGLTASSSTPTPLQSNPPRPRSPPPARPPRGRGRSGAGSPRFSPRSGCRWRPTKAPRRRIKSLTAGRPGTYRTVLVDRLAHLAKTQNNRIDQENTASEYRKHRPIAGQYADDADRNSDCPQKQGMSAWLYPSINSQERSYDKKLIKPTSDQTSHQHSRHTYIDHPSRRQENQREMSCGSERFS